MDQPASLRVKNRRILPDVVDYQLQHKNGMNLKVQPSHQSNGKTYINVFATVKEDCEYKSKKIILLLLRKTVNFAYGKMP